jgi:cell division cycle protein 20 (cofactor of APC complex)
MTSAVVEYENLISTSCTDANSSRPTSGVMPRWKRKQLEASNQSENSSNTITRGDKHHKGKSLSSSATAQIKQPLGAHNSGESGLSGSGCRFIPNRANMDLEKAAHTLRSSSGSSSDGEGSTNGTDDDYKSALNSSVLGIDDNASHRILSFKEKAPAPKGDTVNNLKVLYTSSQKTKTSSKLVSRQIPVAPSRILDAPDLLDDFYINLLSWSDTNILAVALSQTVYLWNAASGDIQELCSFEDGESDTYVSSVSWVQEGGAHLAIGTSEGTTQLWDVQACKRLRTMEGHSDRVGSLSWNRHTLSSGGRDSIVVNHDVRIARHKVATLSSHTQEICGLTWSPDGTTLASGGNDNKVCLWDAAASSTSGTKFTLTEHQAAVKALAWSPHERNLLATGGGTADRTIKFWNTRTGSLLNSIDTGSQVCGLQWNPHEKEILSTHGYARNQMCLWKYPTMAKIKELDGHGTHRALHMATSPDGCTVVSAAADETIRFWDVFALPGKKTHKRSASDLVRSNKGKKISKTMHIR